MPTRQLVTLGEAMLRFSVRAGDRLEDAPAYDVHVAGSEANVAFAAARVGLRAAWVSALPDNALGRRVARTLAAGGVDTSLVRWEMGGRLGLYFVELATAPRAIEVLYDRASSTMALAPSVVFDWAQVADTQFLHVSGITLALSDSTRELTRRAMEAARAGGASVTMDVNYRHRMWGREEAADAVREVAPLVDVLVCTAEDARDLFEAESVDQLQARLGVETVVLTLGGDGAIASRGGTAVRRPGHRVTTVDRVGAGDAFMAGLIWGLVDGSLELGLDRGLAMSALKMTMHGDLFRLDRSDVETLLASDSREVGR
ncbi:MAG TPA: sugar kinase [Candidatus Limnocylindrales bacterium]